MSSATFRIEPMSLDDLNRTLAWAAEEGWNPGLADASCYRSVDPQGFLMGWIGQEPVASLSVVRYGADFGFLGFYIVRPAWRGLGLGWQLWQSGMAFLGDRCVGLDGVLAQQDNYQKSGFVLAYRNIRFQGVGTGQPFGSPQLRPFQSDDLQDLMSWDARVFPAERKPFWQCWLTQKGVIAAIDRDDQGVSGVLVARPCLQGFKIGPLYATHVEAARQLLKFGLGAVPAGQPVFLDVPEINQLALDLARSFDMRSVFETARMYRNGIPQFSLQEVFGVTSFEIG